MPSAELRLTDRIVSLVSSPLAPGASPVRIRSREIGAGAPLVFLHGGWGYQIYPIDRHIPLLVDGRRILIPDRSGYGRSTSIDRLDPDFHRAAAVETIAYLDACGIERASLWGHSDGAVIAAMIALDFPDRASRIVLEATHLSGYKPGSRAFFESTARDPDSVGTRVAAVLEHDHGPRWRDVVARHSQAWLELGDRGPHGGDFYGGRLKDVRAPAMIVHGALDPRTEPGELDAIVAALPRAAHHVLAAGAHSPHSERATGDEVARLVTAFLK